MKRIDIQGLSFGYGKDNLIFQEFDLVLYDPDDRGRITVLMGASGAGKSTLLKILLGIEKPVSGTISLSEKDPVVSYVPQEPVLFEHLSIVDNARYFQFAGAYKKRFNETLYQELIVDLGLQEVIVSDRSVTQLSGGQKQRLSLLRALSINPDYLFLDEPCNGLDAEVKRSFLNKLREVAENYGLFVLYVTHHKLEAQLIADEIIYLAQDKDANLINRASRGTLTEFLQAPPVIEAANVFQFPDVKILCGYQDEAGALRISDDPALNSRQWLISDKNIVIGEDNGIPFLVRSKSDAFAVICHLASDTEWMMADNLFPHLIKGDTVWLNFSGDLLEYNAKGDLI